MLLLKCLLNGLNENFKLYEAFEFAGFFSESTCKNNQITLFQISVAHALKM